MLVGSARSALWSVEFGREESRCALKDRIGTLEFGVLPLSCPGVAACQHHSGQSTYTVNETRPGSEAHGIGAQANDAQPAGAINNVLEATRAGGATGVIGVYGPDPLAPTKAEQDGVFPLDLGKVWIKSPRLSAGQAPIMHYHRELMMAILWDRMPYLGPMLNTKVVSLGEAPAAYETFDQGSSNKFIIDPHGMLAA